MIHPPPQVGKYRCIVVDPPWPTNPHPKRAGKDESDYDKPYDLMTMDDIRDIPIREWADDNCWLWIWATNSKIGKGIKAKPTIHSAIDLMLDWGFKYHTILTWDKKGGRCPYGPYQITSEHIVFGWSGKFYIPQEHMGKMKTVFDGTRSNHSAKPDSFYQSIVEHFPGPRLDVFARDYRDGFDVWGDEAPKNY